MYFYLLEVCLADNLIQLFWRAALIKCSVCGAELARGTPFCPICGSALSFSFRPVIAGLIHLALCLLAMTFIPKPWAYFAAAPFAILALLSFGAGAFGLYRSLLR
jgi:hypothetical protein